MYSTDEPRSPTDLSRAELASAMARLEEAVWTLSAKLEKRSDADTSPEDGGRGCVLASAMFLRSFLAAMALAAPALAQPVVAPDCTVDVTVAKTLRLDIVYRCRSTAALTFSPDDQDVACLHKLAKLA